MKRISKFLKLFVIGVSTAVFLTFAHVGITSAASFNLSPSNSSFERGCIGQIIIQVNATNESSNAGEVEISYDPSQINIIDRKPTIPGVQIEPGDAYEAYVYNSVNTTTGVIKLTGISFLSTLTSQKTFGIIYFEPTAGAISSNFTISFDGIGATLDSNIADSVTNNDLLSNVTNGSYTFINGSCQSDTTPPSVNFISPVNNATNVALDSNVSFQIVDNESGVDLSSLQFIVNGISYSADSPEVQYSGTPNSYTFTVNPSSDFPPGQAITVVVIGSDNAGNQFTSQILFNIPDVVPEPTDRTPPVVIFINPVNLQTGVISGGTVVFSISDDSSGLDLNSLIVYINGQQYFYNSENVSYTVDGLKYTFTITNTNIDESILNVIRVVGRDNSGNTFDQQIIFNIPAASQCPTLPDTGIPRDIYEDILNDPDLLQDLGINCFGSEIELDEIPTIIQNILRNDTPFKGTILENTIVDDISRKTGLSGFAALLSIVLISLNAIPIASLVLGAPGIGLRLLGIILGDRRKNPWGIVKDATTGKPISFAICQIFNKGTQFKLAQTVSDLDGKYGFILNEGSYRLEIASSGYKLFVKDIEIDRSTYFALDVDLIKQDQTADYSRSIFEAIWINIKKFYRLISKTLFLFGFAFSILAVIFSFNLLNLVIFLIYLVLSGIFIIPKLSLVPKYSAVVNSKNQLRVPYAQVKIYNPETRMLVDSKITSYNGLFDFYVEPGRYVLSVSVPGYSFPSKKKNYQKVEDKHTNMIYIDLKNGGNKFLIHIDPIGDLNENKGNIQSPFSQQ